MNKLATLIAFLIAWACWGWVVSCLAIAAIFLLQPGNPEAGILFLLLSMPGLIGHEINKRFVKSPKG